MLKIKLFDLNTEEQLDLLGRHRLMPFMVRYFYRIGIFSYKVLNKNFLRQIAEKVVMQKTSGTSRLRGREPELAIVPNFNKNNGCRRLSVFLPRFINLIIRETYKLPFVEFKNAIFSNSNLMKNFEQFQKHF